MTTNNNRKSRYDGREQKDFEKRDGPMVEQIWTYEDDEIKRLLLSKFEEGNPLLEERTANGRWIKSDAWMEVRQ